MGRGGTEQQPNVFFCGNQNENNELGTGFFVHERIISAVKGIKFVSDMIPCIIQ
jgi:hypothetical protein